MLFTGMAFVTVFDQQRADVGLEELEFVRRREAGCTPNNIQPENTAN
jgi:hypothetical protein